MKTVAVVDYGMGNLRSVAKAVERVASADMRVLLTSDAKTIVAADRIIVPGQGAAKGCMDALQRYELMDVMREVAVNKPFLGICMGLQVLFQSSDENNGVNCLNVIDGKVGSFAENGLFDASKHKLPHMGWNEVCQSQPHALWSGVPDKARFYFVHSYYVQPHDLEMVAATTEYGVKFVCAIGRENIFAVQFHPEKSATIGLKFLSNFIQWDGNI